MTIFRRTILLALMVALTLGVALPARAHGNHDAVVIAANSPAGPFQVSVWVPEGPPVVGENQIAVRVVGLQANTVTLLIDDTSSLAQPDSPVPLQVLPATGVETWIGTVTIDSKAEQRLTVVVTDAGGRTGSLVLPVVPVTSTLIWKVAVWLLAVQALVFADWLLRRARKVWRSTPQPFETQTT